MDYSNGFIYGPPLKLMYQYSTNLQLHSPVCKWFVGVQRVINCERLRTVMSSTHICGLWARVVYVSSHWKSACNVCRCIYKVLSTPDELMVGRV